MRDERACRVSSGWIIPSGTTSHKLRSRSITTYASRRLSAVFEYLHKVTLGPVQSMVFALMCHVSHGEASDRKVSCAFLGIQVVREKTIRKV
jgi:hypothetical protein